MTNANEQVTLIEIERVLVEARNAIIQALNFSKLSEQDERRLRSAEEQILELRDKILQDRTESKKPPPHWEKAFRAQVIIGAKLEERIRELEAEVERLKTLSPRGL